MLLNDLKTKHDKVTGMKFKNSTKETLILDVVISYPDSEVDYGTIKFLSGDTIIVPDGAVFLEISNKA